MPLIADFWAGLAVFLAKLHPPIAAAFLAAIKQVQERIPEAEVTRLIVEGDAAAVAALVMSSQVVRTAFSGLRDSIRDSIEKSALRFVRDVPATRTLAVEFDMLNPRTVAGVTSFEKAVLAETGKTIEATIIQAVEAGIRDGVNPRTIARGIRDIVGLTKEQEVWVRNFRDELVRGDLAALERKLLDKRFVSVIRKAFANGGLSQAQIERMVASNRKRMVAYHADTVARTLSINSMKLGQLQIWKQAVDQGIVDADDITVKWKTRLDGRERETHREMNNVTIRFGEQWYVPGVGLVSYPGEREFNCRCAPVYRVLRKSQDRPKAA